MTGDIGIVYGAKLMSKLIGRLTFGKASHAMLWCEDRIYETEGAWGGRGRSGFSDPKKYDNSRVDFYRFLELTDEDRVRISDLCELRCGIPYSYWDCVTNGLLFFLHPKIKGKIAGLLGTKMFTKCDEEVLTILYLATMKAEFQDTESYTPQTLLELMRMSDKFRLVYRSDPATFEKS